MKNNISKKYTGVLLAVILLITATTGLAQNTEPVDSNTKIKPWLHVLTAGQALSAKAEENKLTFPKEGNPWLSKVEQYHVLWSANAKDPDHLFAVRVLNIIESSDNITFQTAQVERTVLYSGFRDEGKIAKNPAIAISDSNTSIKISKNSLSYALPAKLPGLPTRGFIEINKIEQVFNVVYSGAHGFVQLTIGIYNENSVNKFKKLLKEGGESVKVTKKPYEHGTLIIGQTPSATNAMVYGGGGVLTIWYHFSYPISIDSLYTIFETIG